MFRDPVRGLRPVDHHLALPYLGAEFGADAQTLGSAVGLINVGTILAFIPLRLADRHGRRRVFLFAILGYTLFTVLSACAVGLYDFVARQCLARMFMVTEIGVGAIILTEEMPARWRGAAVTLMFALSLSGGTSVRRSFLPSTARSVGACST